MSSNQGQPESQTPTGDATSTDATQVATEAPVSQSQSTTPEESRVSVVDGYIAAKNAALNAAANPAPEEATPEPQGEPVESEPVAEIADTENEAEADDAPAIDDAPETPVKAQEFRPRLGKFDARKQEAIILAKELLESGEEISLTEAERRVNLKYGISDDPAEAEPEDATPARTVADVRSEIDALKAEKLAAADTFDTRRMIEIDNEIDSKRDEIYEIRESERSAKIQADQQELTAAQREEEAANQRVLDHYTVASDPNHAIHAKADEIGARLQATGNPILQYADSAWRIYQMAANELGIAPVIPGTAPTPAPKAPAAAAAKQPSTTATPKPQAVQQHAVTGRPNPAVAPASGAARQHQPGPTPAISPEKIRTVNDYNRLKNSLVAA